MIRLHTLLLAALLCSSLSALDFAIVNRGEIIFQEILIRTDQAEGDYYFNFGLNGLEPGARHNIHISTAEEMLFCSFYLFGISSENYAIENVAIEEKSVVYILPEHYQEEMEVYRDVDNPDAVYGAEYFDRSEYALGDEESPESQYRAELELFNYTNASIFRVYCLEGEGGSEKKGPVGTLPEGQGRNLLDGRVLPPQESVTIEAVLMPGRGYTLRLKDAEGRSYEKRLARDENGGYLVFYDSDLVSDWENLPLTFENLTPEELTEIYLIDQERGTRVEILGGEILGPGGEADYLLMTRILVCDVVARAASNRKYYMFDWNLQEAPAVPIRED